MILISHDSLEALSITYSNEVYAKFESRKKVIEKVLENLETPNAYDFKGFNLKECLSALKIIISKKKLKKPKSGLKTEEILKHYFGQIYQLKLDSCTEQIDINAIKEWLEAIFSFDLRALFIADITKLKAENEKFKEIAETKGIDNELLDFFFDYTKYYTIINKYIGSELGIICCPYCNRNYITYVFSAKKKRIIGPTYDHFLNKKKYSYVSLSFFNLIPSCTVCNSNLKLQIDFDPTTHLYPYRDEFGNNAVFDFNLSLLESREQKKIIFKPFIQIMDGISNEDKMKLIGSGTDGKGEMTGSINVFKLREIYETHHDTVEEVYEKFDANSKFYIASIKENLTRLGAGEEEFYRYHFNNYFESDNFHKRPLAKLTRDIYDKMKTLQDIASP